jgi:hypothetical protein
MSETVRPLRMDAAMQTFCNPLSLYGDVVPNPRSPKGHSSTDFHLPAGSDDRSGESQPVQSGSHEPASVSEAKYSRNSMLSEAMHNHSVLCMVPAKVTQRPGSRSEDQLQSELTDTRSIPSAGHDPEVS